MLLICPCLIQGQDTKIFRKHAEAIADGDEPEYSQAVEFIKQGTPREIVPFLSKEYLDDDDYDVRKRIISALRLYPVEEYADVWTVFLKSTEDPGIEIELIELLGSIEKNPFIVPLSEKLLVPRAEVRQKAAMVLKKIGDDKVLPVILSLGNSSIPINRIYFLEALNYLYDQRFQKTVINLLGDENKSVRIYALECVLKNEIKEALPQIRNIVKNDENLEVRKRGIRLIVFFKDTQSGNVIASLLQSDDRDLRLEALKGLGELKYSAASGDISKLLIKEKDEEIKTRALDTLAQFRKQGELEGIEYIIKNDPSPALRIMAAWVLGEMKEDAKVIDILEASLTDSDYRVRGEICNSLGNFRKGRSSEILLKQIETDTSRYVRTSALYSLVRINDSKNLVKLFDIFYTEQDMVFRMLLHDVIRAGMVKNIR